MRGQRPFNRIFAKKFARRLRQCINGTPLSTIADDLGIDAHTLWDYVNAKSMPRPDMLVRIASLYDISIDWLLTGQEKQQRQRCLKTA